MNNEPGPFPPPARRIRFTSILTGAAAFWAMAWISFRFSHAKEVFAQVKVPIPALTAFVLSIPSGALLAAGIVLGVLSCLKDLWMDEKHARTLNLVALPILFLFVLAALDVYLSPLESLLEGIHKGP